MNATERSDAAPSDLAEAAVVYAYPLYEMARMRAATRRAAPSPAPRRQRPSAGATLFVHARQLLRVGGSRGGHA